MDRLQLTPLDKSLLIEHADNKRDSQALAFRIALLGGPAAAAKVDPKLVERRNEAGRALRAHKEAQGFKSRRTTAPQRQARQKKATANARRIFQESLDARAASGQNRAFNDLVDATPVRLPTVKAPTLRVHNWRAPEGVLRDRSKSQFKRAAHAKHQRKVNSLPQLPALAGPSPKSPIAISATPSAPVEEDPADDVSLSEAEPEGEGTETVSAAESMQQE